MLILERPVDVTDDAVGSDGMTFSERAEMAAEYRAKVARPLSEFELNAAASRSRRASR